MQAFGWNSTAGITKSAASPDLLCPICGAALSEVEVAQLRLAMPLTDGASGGSFASCRRCRYQILGTQVEHADTVNGLAGSPSCENTVQAHLPAALQVRYEVLLRGRSGIDEDSVEHKLNPHSDSLRAQVQEWLL